MDGVYASYPVKWSDYSTLTEKQFNDCIPKERIVWVPFFGDGGTPNGGKVIWPQTNHPAEKTH